MISSRHAPGAPLQVIPILQTRTRGKQTLTLIALERWTSALYATIELADGTSGSNLHRIVTAEFTADLSDIRDTVYHSHYFGGGAGGGPDNVISHTRIGFMPVPAAGSSLKLAVSTHFTMHITHAPGDKQDWQGDGTTSEEHTWNDPTPWVFTLNMPEHRDQARTLTGEPPTPPRVIRPATREHLDDIGERHQIIPVLETRAVDDVMFTVIALEIGEAGLHLICRVLQRRSRRGHVNRPMRCSVADDRGNGYVVWPGHASGQPGSHGWDWEWWMVMTVLPALDPAATILFVAMESPEEGNELRRRVGGLLEWQETSRWLFGIQLGTR